MYDSVSLCWPHRGLSLMPCSADMDINRTMLLDGLDVRREGQHGAYASRGPGKAVSPPRPRVSNAYIQLSYPSAPDKKTNPPPALMNGEVPADQRAGSCESWRHSSRKTRDYMNDNHRSGALTRDASNVHQDATERTSTTRRADVHGVRGVTSPRPASLHVTDSRTHNNRNVHRVSPTRSSIGPCNGSGQRAWETGRTPPGLHHQRPESETTHRQWSPPTRRSLEFRGHALDLAHGSCDAYENVYQATLRRHRGMDAKTRNVSRSLDDLDFNDESEDSYVEFDANHGDMTPTTHHHQNHHHTARRQLSAPPASNVWMLENAGGRVTDAVSVGQIESSDDNHYIDMNQCRLLSDTNKSPTIAQPFNTNFNHNNNNKGGLSKSRDFESVKQNGSHQRHYLKDAPLSRSHESLLSDGNWYSNLKSLRNEDDNRSANVAKSPITPASDAYNGMLRHARGSNNYVYLTESVLPPTMGGEMHRNYSDVGNNQKRNNYQNSSSVKQTYIHDAVEESARDQRSVARQHASTRTESRNSKRITTRSNTLPHPPKRDLDNYQNNESPKRNLDKHNASPQSQHCQIASDNVGDLHTHKLPQNNVKTPAAQTRRPYLHSRGWSDDIQLRSPSPIPEDDTVLLCRSAPQPGRLNLGFHPATPHNATPTSHQPFHNHYDHTPPFSPSPAGVLTRTSHSEENLPKYRSHSTSDDNSDDNDDDYGFLTISHGSSFLSSAMQKAKPPASPSSQHQQQAVYKALTKKWRRSNKTSGHKHRASLWTPQVSHLRLLSRGAGSRTGGEGNVREI